MKPDFHLSLGTEEFLAEYEAVFHGSPLYDNYFAEDDRLMCMLRDAIEARELWVATNGPGGEIVGAIRVQMKGFFGGFPYLALAGVKQNWRGRGAGHFLLAAFEEAARQQGFDKVSLMASSFNPRAIRLYRSFGYRKIGYLEDAFKKGIGEYIFVKRL